MSGGDNIALSSKNGSARLLLRFEDMSPCTSSKLVVLIISTLTQAGIDCSSYSGHSFRIGAATTASARDFSD